MEKQECIYFIDPEDGEHKETITNARKSWTFRWRRLCLARWERKSARGSCRTLQATESNKKDKACVVEAHASTRQRLESTHEDHIAVKRFNSISPCNLVHTFIQMPAMKIPDAEAAVDREAREVASVAIEQGEEQRRRLFWKQKETKRKSNLRH